LQISIFKIDSKSGIRELNFYIDIFIANVLSWCCDWAYVPPVIAN